MAVFFRYSAGTLQVLCRVYQNAEKVFVKTKGWLNMLFLLQCMEEVTEPRLELVVVLCMLM